MVLSSSEYIGIARQPTLGTPVNPTELIPITPGSLRIREVPEEIIDRGRRGVDSMDFDTYEGVNICEVSFDGMVNEGSATGLAAIGFLLQNILMTASYTATDNGSGSAYDHLIKQGTTKSYLTLERSLINDTNDEQIEGLRVGELVIRFNRGEGAVTYSVQARGRTPTAVTAQNLTADHGPSHMGWQAQVTFDGNASFARLLSAEWTFRRGFQPSYSAEDSQNFGELYLGPLEVLASVVLDFQDNTDRAAFRSNNQNDFRTLFRTGTAGQASERVLDIGGAEFSLIAGPLEVNTSNINAQLPLSLRSHYTTANGPISGAAQNGSIETLITQPVQTAYTA